MLFLLSFHVFPPDVCMLTPWIDVAENDVSSGMTSLGISVERDSKC